MSTAAKQFSRTLKEIGVRYVFGVPSGNMIDYIEALRNEEGIDFVLVGNESTAAFMAGVCGRLTGIPGVCFGTFGPGATNLATGVGSALLDRFPMIAFTDEMPEHLRNRTVQMNIDHQKLFQPLTKFTTRLEVDNVREIILKAAGIAVSEAPGPVHVGVPAGIGQIQALETKTDVNYLQVKKDLSKNLMDDSLNQAQVLYHQAQKPVLAVGLGAVRANIKSLLVQIAEKFQMPVVLTPMAKGMFPQAHPLYTGVLFHALSDKVALTYRQADLVVGIGYDPVEFNHEEWMPPVPLIHFDQSKADVDKDKIKNVENVIGELSVSLNKFLNFKAYSNTWNLKDLKIRKNVLFHELQPKDNNFDSRNIIAGLRKSLPEEGILTVDVGAHLHLAGQMWQTFSPEKLLMTNGWSSMGFAIPAALAAKMCSPEVPVACLCGDGGFLMKAGEIATAKRLNLKIVFVVINDNSLSLIRIKQKNRNYNFSYGTVLDLKELTSEHVFGVPAVRVDNYAAYEMALKEAFASSRPVVIEALTDGSEYDDLVLRRDK